jgi:hypothetical protein
MITREPLKNYRTTDGEILCLVSCYSDGSVFAGGVPLMSQPGFAYPLTVGASFTATNFSANEDERQGLYGMPWAYDGLPHCIRVIHRNGPWLAVGVQDFFTVRNWYGKFQSGVVRYIGSYADAYNFIRSNPAAPPLNWWHQYLSWTPATIGAPVEEWSG